LNIHNNVSKEIYKPSDRRIAEVLYMMGLTYANNDDFTKASEYFERAKDVLENTIGDFLVKGKIKRKFEI